MHWLFLILTIPYLYILLRQYGSLLRIRAYMPSGKSDIFASVIIACRNEEENLPLLLKDISEQDYDAEKFEVIVVDDNSQDKTFETTSAFSDIMNLKVLKNSGSGKKQAIRTGVEASSGQIILTTDADCRMDGKWLDTVVSFFSENNPDMIICPVMLESRSGFLNKLQELEYLSLQGITAATAESGNPVMCNGANMAFTREAYYVNSGNLRDDIPSGDDVFLLHSIKRDKRKKILWLESQEAVVTTRSMRSLGSFLKQRARWLSKAGAYRDASAIVLGIVTFVTILLLWFFLFAAFSGPQFLLLLAAAFILKSIPDYLILSNTVSRYGKRNLMRFFIPAQLLYPVYVLMVIFYGILSGRGGN